MIAEKRKLFFTFLSKMSARDHLHPMLSVCVVTPSSCLATTLSGQYTALLSCWNLSGG